MGAGGGRMRFRAGGSHCRRGGSAAGGHGAHSQAVCTRARPPKRCQLRRGVRRGREGPPGGGRGARRGPGGGGCVRVWPVGVCVCRRWEARQLGGAAAGRAAPIAASRRRGAGYQRACCLIYLLGCLPGARRAWGADFSRIPPAPAGLQPTPFAPQGGPRPSDPPHCNSSTSCLHLLLCSSTHPLQSLDDRGPCRANTSNRARAPSKVGPKLDWSGVP